MMKWIGKEVMTQPIIGDITFTHNQNSTSDTSLTVTSAFSNNANDTTPDCNPEAKVDVIIS